MRQPHDSGNLRVSDIAQVMEVQMPTVTGALRHLAEHGLVNYEPYQFVMLTEACVGACLEEAHERTPSDDAGSGERPDSPDPGSQDQ